jgi:hypothetical protein
MIDEEKRKRQAFEGAQFLKRMERDHPEHRTLYCDHATYIGYNGLFKEKCERCTLPNCGHDMAILRVGDFMKCVRCSRMDDGTTR